MSSRNALVLIFSLILTALFVMDWDWIVPVFSVRETKVEISCAETCSESLRRQRALIEEVSCRQSGIGARGGFCLMPEEVGVGGNWMWEPELARKLEELFVRQRVGDLGAGLGWYGRYWMRKLKPFFYYGKEIEFTAFLNLTAVVELKGRPPKILSWKGYDGAGNVELVTSRWVEFLDLTEEQDLPEKFDWVISLEVGEHIPNPFESIFVGNLARHACKGIVLSWAMEGQGGHYHVNNHNNTYVKKLMQSYGFENDIRWEEKLREVTMSYFANTLMVFRRRNCLDHPKCKMSHGNK